MKLIARWTEHQDASTEQPYSVSWEDGTPATLSDFKRHLLDTHSLHHDELGRVEQHFYPDVVAQVKWDQAAMDWVVSAPDIQTFALELHDPHVKDDQIVEALYTFRKVYRARIVRPVAPTISPVTYVN
jgi:hypothetical protein